MFDHNKQSEGSSEWEWNWKGWGVNGVAAKGGTNHSNYLLFAYREVRKINVVIVAVSCALKKMTGVRYFHYLLLSSLFQVSFASLPPLFLIFQPCLWHFVRSAAYQMKTVELNCRKEILLLCGNHQRALSVVHWSSNLERSHLL